MGVVHSFSIKNIFHDKTDLWYFHFCVTMQEWERCWFRPHSQDLGARLRLSVTFMLKPEQQRR